MSTNSEAMATELTIKVRRPRVAVSALLWSGIMLSALLSLTYTHSFANYGRPDARVEDQQEGDALIRTNGDPSADRKDDADRDDEVEDDEDDEGDGGEDEDLSQNSSGARASKRGALQKEAGGVPGRVARKGSTTKTFWETIPTVLGDEIPNPHASVREASEPDLENRGNDGQKHRHSSAHAHAVVAAGASSAASAGPQNHGAPEGIEGEESAELETMILSSSGAERGVGSAEREVRTPR